MSAEPATPSEPSAAPQQPPSPAAEPQPWNAPAAPPAWSQPPAWGQSASLPPGAEPPGAIPAPPIANPPSWSAGPPAVPYGAAPYGTPPDNYLVWGILATVLCCLPLGIPSIVFASQVNTKWAAGDAAGALDASRKARQFAMWSFIAGLVTMAVYFGFVILAGAGSWGP